MLDPAAKSTIDLTTGHLIGLFQRHVPDLVSALHLVGSIADGDFRPGRSDFDFVAVLNAPATANDIEALGIVHRLYAADGTLPALDGIWVTAADLAAGPDAAADGPSSASGDFLASACGNRNPVTWAMLRTPAITVLGHLDRETLWGDPARLRSWTVENVEAYWAPWLERAAAPKLAMLGRKLPQWGVLGISRLHFTLATGGIASKSAAGDYARAAFEPRWHRIIEDCLKARRGEWGSLYHNPLHRRRDALAYVAMVIAAIRAAATP